MKKMFITGFFYSSIGKFGNLFVNLLVTSILSRILTPSEYGIIAIVQVFILFFQMIVEAGMGPAIIQSRNLNKNDISILFNFSVIFSIVLSLSFGLFGYLIAFFYKNTIYISISWIETIAIFFNGLSIVPLAILNKNKEFKKVNIIQLTSSIISGSGGIVSAYFGYGVYSLVLSAIIFSFINFVLYMSISDVHINVSLKKDSLYKIIDFSKHQFLFNFINYFSRNADNILVGKFMGPSALGNYSKVYQLLMMPNSVLLGIINPVLQPILSDYQDEVNVIKVTFFKLIKVLAYIGIPLSFFLSTFSSEIIFILFGSQWANAIVPFKILSLTVWIQMTLSSTGAIFQARNKVKELMVNGIISAIILVSSIIIGVCSGSLTILSLCLTVGFFLNFIVSMFRLMNLVLDSSINELLKNYLHPLYTGIAVWVVLYFSKMINIKNSLFYLLFQGVVFIGVLIFFAFILGDLKSYFRKNRQ